MLESRYLYYYQTCVLDTLILTRRVNSQMELPKLRGAVCTASSTKGTTTVLTKGAMEIVLGQKASTTRAKKSIAQFNLREKSVVSCRVTLRGKRFYNFLDLLINFIAPKIDKNFSKTNQKPIKQDSNLFLPKSINIGINNFLEFPQLEPFFPEFESLKGFNINIMIMPKKITNYSKGKTWIWGF